MNEPGFFSSDNDFDPIKELDPLVKEAFGGSTKKGEAKLISYRAFCSFCSKKGIPAGYLLNLAGSKVIKDNAKTAAEREEFYAQMKATFNLDISDTKKPSPQQVYEYFICEGNAPSSNPPPPPSTHSSMAAGFTHK
jgi:hypothetical protein